MIASPQDLTKVMAYSRSLPLSLPRCLSLCFCNGLFYPSLYPSLDVSASVSTSFLPLLSSSHSILSSLHSSRPCLPSSLASYLFLSLFFSSFFFLLAFFLYVSLTPSLSHSPLWSFPHHVPPSHHSSLLLPLLLSLPLLSNLTGMLEVVTDSATLRTIQTEHGVTGSFKDKPLSEWLMRHNPTDSDYKKVRNIQQQECVQSGERSLTLHTVTLLL